MPSIVINSSSNLVLETVETPPQNATTPLQEHQQKVIDVDVVQSETPALTATATQNLVSFWIYLIKIFFVGSCGSCKERRDRDMEVSV